MNSPGLGSSPAPSSPTSGTLASQEQQQHLIPRGATASADDFAMDMSFLGERVRINNGAQSLINTSFLTQFHKTTALVTALCSELLA